MSNEANQKRAEAAGRAAGTGTGLGCLPFVLSCLLLSSMGFCGTCAKQNVLDGVRDIRQAAESPTAK